MATANPPRAESSQPSPAEIAETELGSWLDPYDEMQYETPEGIRQKIEHTTQVANYLRTSQQITGTGVGQDVPRSVRELLDFTEYSIADATIVTERLDAIADLVHTNDLCGDILNTSSEHGPIVISGGVVARAIGLDPREDFPDGFEIRTDVDALMETDAAVKNVGRDLKKLEAVHNIEVQTLSSPARVVITDRESGNQIWSIYSAQPFADTCRSINEIIDPTSSGSDSSNIATMLKFWPPQAVAQIGIQFEKDTTTQGSVTHKIINAGHPPLPYNLALANPHSVKSASNIQFLKSKGQEKLARQLEIRQIEEQLSRPQKSTAKGISPPLPPQAGLPIEELYLLEETRLAVRNWLQIVQTENESTVVSRIRREAATNLIRSLVAYPEYTIGILVTIPTDILFSPTLVGKRFILDQSSSNPRFEEPTLDNPGNDGQLENLSRALLVTTYSTHTSLYTNTLEPCRSITELFAVIAGSSGTTPDEVQTIADEVEQSWPSGLFTKGQFSPEFDKAQFTRIATQIARVISENQEFNPLIPSRQARTEVQMQIRNREHLEELVTQIRRIIEKLKPGKK